MDAVFVLAAISVLAQAVASAVVLLAESRERQRLTKELVRAYSPAAAAAMDAPVAAPTPRQPAPRPDVDFLGL